MMDVLLDTHTFIWGLSDSKELSPVARDLLLRPEVVKQLSLASVWEMAIKCGIGKLRLPLPLEQSLGLARRAGLRLSAIELDFILKVEALPAHHRDPFDRLLACHCLEKSLPLVSRDPIFDQYGVNRIW